jgi:hypothetical protein
VPQLRTDFDHRAVFHDSRGGTGMATTAKFRHNLRHIKARSPAPSDNFDLVFQGDRSYYRIEPLEFGKAVHDLGEIPTKARVLARSQEHFTAFQVICFAAL